MEVVALVGVALGLVGLEGLFGPLEVEGVAHAVLEGERISVVVVLQGVGGQGMPEEVGAHYAQRVPVGVDVHRLAVGCALFHR